MDNDLTPPLPAVTSNNILDIVCDLRENSARQEQLLAQIIAFLQESAQVQHDRTCEDVARHEQLLEQVKAFSRQSVLVRCDKGHEASPDTSAISAWLPPGEIVEVLDVSLLKIHQVEKSKDISKDIVSRLRATGIGKFYANHLKQYPFFRWLSAWLWRNLYPIYVNNIAIHLRNSNAKRWRPLVKLNEFVKRSGIPIYKVADAALVETPVPKVVPACDQNSLVSPHDRYNFPEIVVAKIADGMIYGGTNLLLTKDVVICHDLFDFECDYTSEELHARTLIDPKSKRIRWLLFDEAPERIPAAAAFVDACASNYAHWLTEVLPRVAAFCANDQFKTVPIVVNDGLHKNIMESLFLVAGEGREIITLPIGRALHVDEIYLTSVAGYVPFERRSNKLFGHSHGIFSPRAFELIRNQVALFAEKLPEVVWPEKIYLRRNSGGRKVTNTAELEELLVSHGYVIVEPEKLTFLQQVQLFSNSKSIVGSSGAAFANIVLAPHDVKIFILIGKYPDTSYWYWQNMACASGKTVSYVFGEINDSAYSGIHADFMIDLENLLQELGEEL